ncbi:MAG: M20 family metallopeptidase [Candidatus Dormiibacterota bacterium]
MTAGAVEITKQRIRDEVEQLHPHLRTISHSLHDDPELGNREFHAAQRLTEELAENGFQVERGIAGLETAFVATYGSGKPVVAIIAEYDALPKLGHACGHNLIATWAVGAGIALRNALPEVQGTIKVIGTPAEESAGGKVTMTEHGIFDGVDAAMMIHGSDRTILNRGSLAVTPYTVEYFGKSSHASSRPEAGISALDALLQVYFGVNQLRQMLRPMTRIHGVITDGGDAPNVIPDHAEAAFLVRARDEDYLDEVRQRFRGIAEGAALATGARLQLTEGISYRTRVCNDALVSSFGENVETLGLEHETLPVGAGVGSSDIGNVSHVVPTIHPYLKIADRGTSAHTPAFAQAAASPFADEQIATGCTLLAWTAADVLLRPELREELRRTFKAQLGHDPA